MTMETPEERDRRIEDEQDARRWISERIDRHGDMPRDPTAGRVAVNVTTLDPADFTIGPGAIIPIRWIPRACVALKPMGWDFDAVEWDWPRWGRRILVSRNDRVLYDPHPGAKHVEIGFAHDA